MPKITSRQVARMEELRSRQQQPAPYARPDANETAGTPLGELEGSEHDAHSQQLVDDPRLQMEGEVAANDKNQKPSAANVLTKRSVAVLQKKMEAMKEADKPAITEDSPLYSHNQLMTIQRALVAKADQDLWTAAGVGLGLGLVGGFMASRYLFSSGRVVEAVEAAADIC
jgi:hypothetical protein